MREKIPSETVLHETIIAGAGAAGLFCAWLLARAKKPFILLERGGKAGRKLAASGGGHANFTNSNMSPDCFYGTGAADFCQHGLNKFGASTLLNIISGFGLHYVKKDDGKYFLRESAAMLAHKLLAGTGGRLCLNTAVSGFRPLKGKFEVSTSKGKLVCKNLVLAPGSPARPALAQCPDCWAILRNAGLPVSAPRPALAPLIYAGNSYREFAALSGISAEVLASLAPGSHERPQFQGRLLFTHFGLSGPVILNASLHYRRGGALVLNFLPEASFEQLCDSESGKTSLAILSRLLPRKLALALLPEDLRNRNCAELSRKQRQLLGAAVNKREFANMLPGGLARAEICSGGVDLAALKAESMECRHFPGLYIIGEAQDVAGKLGGYNLHWAFASASCAASHIISRR